ncbi:hypothetical protein [Chryseobacterium sp. JM1]|uniref:FEKKY domain-containing protein n=1 Tax=Chryseobacterium sp. JM1 TaxID=1233950 RepID=UPI0004E7444C|nr:hypothetical protein [Chryseobacterium sp. JM1]KFF21985.1 hypothetical protein IW22_08675 [Chryseobacterium sp. JM1]
MKLIKITYLLIILSILIQSCSEQGKKGNPLKTENDYTLLMYGLPNMEKQNSRNVIAEKWEIKFESVAGCVVTKELTDSVKTINDRVGKNIEKKYGKNWKTEFEKEIQEEYAREKQITAILDKVDFIKKKDEQMDKEGNGLVYYMTPIKNSTTDYHVSVEGWDTINDKDVWVSYYRMTANYKTKEYKLLEDKIQPRE